MKIKKIDLISYGKFQNKEIKFSKNLNIILGENESGKSTIRNFIFDMIFGGTTPDSKRAIFKKEHENMIPWDSSNFEGAMEINENYNNYYLYRNFNKNNLEFQIVNSDNHEDSKSDFNVDISRKVERIDENYFEISEKSLRDIFLITDEEIFGDLITYDLKDRIINYATSQSENYSLRDIIENIENYSYGKDIKKERQIIINNLQNLENELDYIKVPYNYEDYFLESKNLNDEIDNIKDEIEYLEDDLSESLNSTKDLDNREQYQARFSEKNKLEESLEKIEEKSDLYKYFKLFRLFYIFPILSSIYYSTRKIRPFIASIVIFLIFIILDGLFSKILKHKKKSLKNEESKIYAHLDRVNYELMTLSNINNNDINIDSREILEKINFLKDNLSNKLVERESLYSKINIIDKDMDRIKSINEEKKILKSKLEEIEYMREMGKKAVDIINEISKTNFDEVSRKVLEDSSSFFEFLTNGKYSAINVRDEKLYVYSNYHKKYILSDNLSRGTISQMYLCYKLGIIVNSGIDFPIIIDDGFVFFDMSRNKNAIKLLERISKDYQILYFTSNIRDLHDLEKSDNTKLINLE